MLSDLDVSQATEKAKNEVKDALKVLKKPKIFIDDTSDHRKKVGDFFTFMFKKFPELTTEKNKALLHQWTGTAKEKAKRVFGKK